jgi:tetratricopeptide (TPR) repeat protein
VRIEAARVLVLNGISRLGGSDDQALASALEEYRTGLNNDSDRSGAHLTLGSLAEQLGNTEAAEKEYRTAIALEPSSSGGRANLAALLGRQLEQLAQNPNAVSQMTLLQQEIDQLRAEELELLKRDADLLPNNANLQYRLGLALYLAGQNDEAERRLQKAVDRDPADVNFLMALVLLQERLEKNADAKANARRLYELAPTPVHEEILRRVEGLP